MSTTSETDRIERSILVNAPRERVWRALTTAENFGTWFGVNLKDQTFAAGQRTRGLMDASCGHEDVWFDIIVERIDPQDLFSYRWNPYPVDLTIDYSVEEPTLVTFTLKDAPDKSTLITVVESGFDKIPSNRRMEAFRMHTNGWEAQLKNVANYANTH
ncbi:hypothetical protein GCM10011613_01650 [Cellvibrio zantedeschiae]|uniref:Activator of Hsp90 ATPase homologue 1/2-like C-terminal domain-containing protein n=1 Tax=Cellvibrio zantedeschiae TaxID=1237077 RepID=A0ABQ3AN26_9GAMM|nr:SRPBCC family protein [Cellvibrio zantedeschiae]GGY61871.1 hypothetical protein GCM10011613_01650 [Cellvibrio zantedeschiae]